MPAISGVHARVVTSRAIPATRAARRLALAAVVALAMTGAALADPEPAAQAPAGMEPATLATAPAPGATMRSVDPDAPRLPARLDDGSRIALPPMVIPQDRPATDRRPVYVGAGLIAFAVVFWWNRRRRDLFEREAQGDPPVRAPRARQGRDADADDLHAAALGDGPPPTPEPAASDPPRKPSP